MHNNISYVYNKILIFLLIMIGILGVLEQDWGTCDTIYTCYIKIGNGNFSKFEGQTDGQTKTINSPNGIDL